MKAWQKQLADLYLLAHDILQNHFLQQHEHKSRFYYTFNPQLNFKISDGDYESQIGLLDQLAAKGTLTYHEIDPDEEFPRPKTPRPILSKNTRKYGGRPVVIRVQPNALITLVKDLEKYRPKKAAISLSARFNDSTGDLLVGDYIIHFQPNSNGCYLLRFILEDRKTRKDDWAHNEIERALDRSQDLRDRENFVRNTANNVNRRIAIKTNGEVKDFLVVTTKSIHLNSRFV